ncbi:MAG: hypothetical protein V1667_02860 [bacterium]
MRLRGRRWQDYSDQSNIHHNPQSNNRIHRRKQNSAHKRQLKKMRQALKDFFLTSQTSSAKKLFSKEH